MNTGRQEAAGIGGGSDARREPLRIGPDALEGELERPAAPRGLVVFVHGSGSSRTSPRNRRVARRLRDAGLATLLFDLMTPGEAQDRQRVFDIPWLATRILQVLDVVATRGDLAALPVGLFGASTGAAAALWAAAERPGAVAAVVSRGGRPDLASPRLAAVHAATLLIVGSRDQEVLALNRLALAALRAPARLEVVAGASHLFEEPGTLDAAAELAAAWFATHLGAAAHAMPTDTEDS
jgi:putative phosphoribosyl transferase